MGKPDRLIAGLCLRAARALVVFVFPAAAVAEEALVLVLPIACEPGRSCFIQNYVDADPSSASRDYQCGTLTYDRHNGTDFRLPNMAAQRTGVDVLAAAPGRVVRRRDSIADVSVRSTGATAVKNVECGNGVVIEHAAGWQTQYCHLARGSLRVELGDSVEAHQPIGRVGLSGLTEYPHLHFIVRYRGAIVDPFAHQAPPQSCEGGRLLWEPGLHGILTYRSRGVLNAGFATGSVTMAALEAGELERRPGVEAPALVAYARGMGLKAGDIQTMIMSSPSGEVLAKHEAQPLERNQAQSLIFAGFRKPSSGWSKGTYQAKYRVSRDGNAVLDHDIELDLP